MSCLLKIRALRDNFSANERRIADFILENSQLMRDYSSQQLASAVNVSQSSIVKFSQKLTYKGYPDLKMAINEAVVIDQTNYANTPSNQLQESQSQSLTTVQNLISDALNHFQAVNSQLDITEFASELIAANKTVILSTSFGKTAAASLVNILLDLGKVSRTIASDFPHDLNTLQGLNKGDVLLIIEDNPLSNSLISAITSLNRQGVVSLLVNRMGHSVLHGVTTKQIEWVVTESTPSLMTCQAQACLLSLMYSLELEIANQGKC